MEATFISRLLDGMPLVASVSPSADEQAIEPVKTLAKNLLKRLQGQQFGQRRIVAAGAHTF